MLVPVSVSCIQGRGGEEVRCRAPGAAVAVDAAVAVEEADGGIRGDGVLVAELGFRAAVYAHDVIVALRLLDGYPFPLEGAALGSGALSAPGDVCVGGLVGGQALL